MNCGNCLMWEHQIPSSAQWKHWIVETKILWKPLASLSIIAILLTNSCTILISLKALYATVLTLNSEAIRKVWEPFDNNKNGILVKKHCGRTSGKYSHANCFPTASISTLPIVGGCHNNRGL